VPIRDVLYLEAYDNYSFVYDTAGDRYLCSHALGFMERQLGDGFLRVHRKYLIQKSRVSSITPHLKGRYVIEFDGAKKPTLISSSGYTEAVKSLFRL
jgi:DNA-binding LytR/AlgR family response regulator